MKLKSTELGILGFEEVRSWNVVEKDEIIMVIQSADPSGPSSRFMLLHSMAAEEMLKRNLPNVAEDNWFIACTGPDETTINTRAPVIINDNTVQQVLTTKGSVMESLVKRESVIRPENKPLEMSKTYKDQKDQE